MSHYCFSDVNRVCEQLRRAVPDDADEVKLRVVFFFFFREQGWKEQFSQTAPAPFLLPTVIVGQPLPRNVPLQAREKSLQWNAARAPLNNNVDLKRPENGIDLEARARHG